EAFKSQAMHLAFKLNIGGPFFTSAKTGNGVEEPFCELIRLIRRKQRGEDVRVNAYSSVIDAMIVIRLAAKRPGLFASLPRDILRIILNLVWSSRMDYDIWKSAAARKEAATAARQQ